MILKSLEAKSIRKMLKKDFVAKSPRFKTKNRRVQLRAARKLNFLKEKIYTRVLNIDKEVNKLIEIEQYTETMGTTSRNEFIQGKLRTFSKIEQLTEKIENEKIKILECERLGKRIFTSFNPTTGIVNKHTTLERTLHEYWKMLQINESLLDRLSRQLKGLSPSMENLNRNRAIAKAKF